FLDVAGAPVEIPVADPGQAAGVLAGALASVELEHVELRSTAPRAADVVASATMPELVFSELPDPASISAVGLFTGAGTAVAGEVRVQAVPQGGVIRVTPSAALASSTDFELRVASTLADLGGGVLGGTSVTRFRSGAVAQ